MLYGLTMHSERAEPPHVRAVAPARRRRRHHCLQLPGRGVGLERVPRGRLRQRHRVEAFAQDAALRRCRPADLQPGSRAARLSRHLPAVRRREPRPRDALRRRSARGARLVHRLDARRAATWASASHAVSAGACSNSAATTRSSSTSSRTSISPCRRSCSARSAPPASAARRRAGCSCRNRVSRNSSSAWSVHTGRCASAIRSRPAR